MGVDILALVGPLVLERLLLLVHHLPSVVLDLVAPPCLQPGLPVSFLCHLADLTELLKSGHASAVLNI